MNKFTPKGKVAIETILRCMKEADEAFKTLNEEEAFECAEYHIIPGSSLNHCTRLGLKAAEDIHAEFVQELKT